MASMSVKWGKTDILIPTEAANNLSTLKGVLSDKIGMSEANLSLFYDNRYISGDNELADVMKSPGVVLFLSTKQPINIYIRFFFVVRQLNVFDFYPIEFVRLLCISLYDDSIDPNITSESYQLCFMNKILRNENKIQDLNIQNGHILDISYSGNINTIPLCFLPGFSVPSKYDSSSATSSLTPSPTPSIKIPPDQLFLFTLVFTQLSLLRTYVSGTLATQYFRGYDFSIDTIQKVLALACCGPNSFVDKNQFSVIHYYLCLSQPQKVPSQLPPSFIPILTGSPSGSLSHSLSDLHPPSSVDSNDCVMEQSFEWLLDYETAFGLFCHFRELQKVLKVVGKQIPVTKCINSFTSVCPKQDIISSIMKLMQIRSGDAISVQQFMIIHFLCQSASHDQPIPSALPLNLRCILTMHA